MKDVDKMGAYISGKVVGFVGDDIVVECENRNVVSGNLGDMIITIPESIFQNPKGLEVEAEGYALYSNGCIDVYLEEVRFWKEDKFLGSYDKNIEEKSPEKPKPSLKTSLSMNLNM